MPYYTRTYNPQPTARVTSQELKNEFQAIDNALDAVEVDIGKGVRAPEATTALPNAASRALKVMSFDASGNPIATVLAGDVADAADNAAIATAKAAEAAASAVAAHNSELAAAASAATVDIPALESGKYLSNNGVNMVWQAITPPQVLQRAITSTDTLIASDQGKLINASGTFTLAVTAAATLGNGWYCYVRNTGTGTITLDPNGAETVDGVTSGPVRDTILLVCDGTGFSAAKVGPHSAIETLTTGTSWTCPLGVRRIKLRAVGAGAAGVSTGVVGQGGSSGGYIEKVITVVPATAYTYAIGAGGTGVINDYGGAGGATTFTAGGTTYTAGGAGVSGTTGAATTGDFNLPGRRGTGVPVSGNFSSLGGDTPLGAAGRIHSAHGSYAPVGYGAGGFGTPSDTAGGSGAPGVIILEY